MYHISICNEDENTGIISVISLLPKAYQNVVC